jgi:hypothetical protein
MGCRLVRGETIYFVRQAGRISADLDGEWLCDGLDGRLLPPVYTCSDGRMAHAVFPGAVPVEIRTFEGS